MSAAKSLVVSFDPFWTLADVTAVSAVTQTLWIHLPLNCPERTWNSLDDILQSLVDLAKQAKDIRVTSECPTIYPPTDAHQYPVVGYGNEAADVAAMDYDWESADVFVVGSRPLASSALRRLKQYYDDGVLGPRLLFPGKKPGWVWEGFDRGLIGQIHFYQLV
jgi:hypothetical protein